MKLDLTYSERINKFKEFCFEKHNTPAEAQRYGNAPYSKHLQDVLDNGERYIHYIAEDKRDIVRCALVGHDLFEDTELGPSDIEKTEGREVADIILRVSNERGWDRKERNFKTYPKIWVSDFAIYVKLADRMANTRNSKNGTDEKAQRMYKIYCKEYPVFRYALKVRNLYPDMWAELDSLCKE